MIITFARNAKSFAIAILIVFFLFHLLVAVIGRTSKNRNWETRWMEGDTEDLRLYKAQSGQETEIK